MGSFTVKDLSSCGSFFEFSLNFKKFCWQIFDILVCLTLFLKINVLMCFEDSSIMTMLSVEEERFVMEIDRDDPKPISSFLKVLVTWRLSFLWCV